MLTRRSIIKLIAILILIVVGVTYWIYAERKSSPLEEVEKTVQQQ